MFGFLNVLCGCVRACETRVCLSVCHGKKRGKGAAPSSSSPRITRKKTARCGNAIATRKHTPITRPCVVRVSYVAARVGVQKLRQIGGARSVERVVLDLFPRFWCLFSSCLRTTCDGEKRWPIPQNAKITLVLATPTPDTILKHTGS